MNSNVKTLIFWLVLIAVAVLLYKVARRNADLPFAQFLDKVKSGDVKEVTIAGLDVRVTLKSSTRTFRTRIPPNQTPPFDLLKNSHVNVTVEEQIIWAPILANIAILTVAAGIWFFVALADSGAKP